MDMKDKELRIEIVMDKETALQVEPNKPIQINVGYDDEEGECTAVFYTRRTLENENIRLFGKVLPVSSEQ